MLDASSQPWTLPPDPASGVGKKLAIRPFDAGETDNNSGVFLARDVPNAVIAQHVSDGDASVEQATLCDLVQERVLGSARLPDGCTVLALSPDGKEMAVALGGSEGAQVAIWNWGADATCSESATRLEGEARRTIKRAAYLAPARLLVQEKLGKTRVYDTGTGKVEHLLDIEDSQWPAISPGGRWFTTYDESNSNVRFHESSTGAIVGTLGPLQGEAARFASSAFSPDGERFALVLSRPEQRQQTVLCWDVNAGEQLAEFQIPYASAVASEEDVVWWCGSDHLMFGQRLYRLEVGGCVWCYTNVAPAGLCRGHPWITVRDSGRKCLLLADLPRSGDLAVIDEKISSTWAMLQAGDALRVEVRGGERAPTARLERRVSRTVGERLKSKGYRLDSYAAMCLRVTALEETEGEPLEYRDSWWMERASVPNTLFCLKLELIDPKGATRWEVQCEVPMPEEVRVRDPVYENGVIEEVREKHWEAAIDLLEGLEFPDPFQKSALENGFGFTDIRVRSARATRDAAPYLPRSTWFNRRTFDK